MPVVVIAKLKPKPEHLDEVEQALAALVPEVHQEAGCDLYSVHRSADEFWFVEQWSDEAAVAGHDAGAPIQAFLQAIDGKLLEPAMVVRLTPMQLGEPSKSLLRH